MLTIRKATKADAQVLHALICALADYEREPDAVEVTSSELEGQLASENPPFECLLAEQADKVIGFVLFFPNYSTWLGKPGMDLEDIFVLPEHRGLGAARALLRCLAVIAVKRGYGRIDFSVLGWNTDAQDFFRSQGAVSLEEWVALRILKEGFTKLAQ